MLRAGDRMLLRPFDDGDAAAFAAAARESVATAGRWMPWCSETYGEQDALDWFAACRADAAAGTAHEFGIFDRETAAFIGGAGLNLINHQHLYGNLGYWVRQSWQGQGVAVRCVQALATHAFDALGLRRVEIVVAEGNSPSEAVAHKCGARLECVARQRLHIRSVSVPASVFSLVADARG